MGKPRGEERDARRILAECGTMAIVDLSDRVSALEEVVRRQRRALMIATVTLASVWPEDFRRAFGDDAIRAMVEATRPEAGTDFRVEDVLRAVLQEV